MDLQLSIMKIKVTDIKDYTEKDWEELRQSVVDKLYNDMFERRVGPNSPLQQWNKKSFFGGGNKDKYKALIDGLIKSGSKVKTGYECSSMIRNAHEHFVYWTTR
jgi:hypothetical protein